MEILPKFKDIHQAIARAQWVGCSDQNWGALANLGRSIVWKYIEFVFEAKPEWAWGQSWARKFLAQLVQKASNVSRLKPNLYLMAWAPKCLSLKKRARLGPI